MDRVFFNGKIYVEREHFEQAMLVQDDRIVRVGSDGEVLAAAPNGCERVDLEGRTVVPGFNDSHLHILMLGDNLQGRKDYIAENGYKFLDQIDVS